MSTSRLIQDRADKTRALITLITELGPNLDIVANASAIWPELMPQSTAPISEILNAHVEGLQRAQNQLLHSTLDIEDEKADDLDLRGQIGEAIIELRDTIDRTRERIIEIDGHATLQLYRMDAPPPLAKQALIDYTQTIIDLMRAHPYIFRDDLGEPIDTKRVAKSLKTALKPLSKLASQMHEEIEELQIVLKQRNDAFNHWNTFYQGTYNLLEGFLRLANLEDGIKQLKQL